LVFVAPIIVVLVALVAKKAALLPAPVEEMRTNIVANIVAIIAGIIANSIFFIVGGAIIIQRQPIQLQFALVLFIAPIIVVLVALVAKKAALLPAPVEEMRTNIVANIVAIIAGIIANSIFFIVGGAIIIQRQPNQPLSTLLLFIAPIIVVLVALVAKKA